jgi:hypothetical protein
MKEVHPAKVMLALRDHQANDVDALCTLLGLNPSIDRFGLENVLIELQASGLIVHTGPADNLSGTFDVIPNWRRIQATLGISLTRLAEERESMDVKPYFGKPNVSDTPLDVFVMMWFSPELRPVYEDHILDVTKSLHLATKRADEFYGAHHIMSDVWEAINSARVIIADCTGRNPNVFYEMGLAHTLGKRVIMITQNRADVPFDVSDTRYILYEYTPPGMKQFQSTLAQALQEELKGDPEAKKKDSFCP